MRIISRLLILACLLFAPSIAHAQTNPLGAGYSLTNGQLYVQISPSLNSFTMPFSISMIVTAPTVNGSQANNFLTSIQGGSTTGGFAVQYNTTETYRLKSIIQPATTNGGGTSCSHVGQMCWRFPFVNDGNRHHVCVRWTPTQGYFYLDGILRDQTLAIPPSGSGGYAATPELFWSLGNGAPTTWTFFDTRVYNSDIGGGGCVTLSNLNQLGKYPTTGALSTGMVLHLPLDNCTTVGSLVTCNDTSGNSNTASNATSGPSISITNPSAGTVSGNVNLTVSCTLTSGTCAKVCYYVDGFLISVCPSVTSPTYILAWNTPVQIADGSHTLTAVGYSVSGITTTSSPVAITVSNGVAGINYYFKGIGGNDTNNCTTISTPCQSVTKFNSLTYKAGDTVHLDASTTFSAASSLVICGPGAGSACTQNFYPGVATFTITNYNASACNTFASSATVTPANCAIIQRTGTGTTSGIKLYNASNTTLVNVAPLGTANTLAAQTALGIEVVSTFGLGQFSGLTVQNVYTNSWGGGIAGNLIENGNFPTWNTAFGPITNYLIEDSVFTGPFGTANSGDLGITMGTLTQGTSQDNLVYNQGGISGNSQGNGIAYQNYPSPNGTPSVAQFNVVHDNGGNANSGIGGPYALYMIRADLTTFQFNEQYNQRCWNGGYPACVTGYSGIDNGGADLDHGTTRGTYQYNYIHDNPMSFGPGMNFFVATGDNSPPQNPGWNNNLISYNIFENNSAGIEVNIQTFGLNTGSFIFNNTFSSNMSLSGSLYFGSCFFSGTGMIPFYNNLCMITGSDSISAFFVTENFPPNSMDHNAYWATAGTHGWRNNFSLISTFAAWQASTGHPDLHGVNVNPMIAGTAGTGGICYTSGTPSGPAPCPSPYVLQAGSPLIGAGEDMNAVFGITVGAQDYYGQTIPRGGGSGYPIGASAGP